MAATACLLAVPSADAAVTFTVYSSFPSTMAVGATGLAGQLTIANNSTSPEGTSTVTLTAIDLVPSCGSTTAPGGVCQSADPGVFQVGAAGTGEAGTGCPGTTFTTSIVDSTTGEVSFTPTTTVTLAANGPPTAQCVIDFTFSVLKAPSKDASTSAPGLQTAQISSASGTATSDSATGLSTTSAVTTVTKAVTALSAQASGSTTLGNSISDSATLSGGSSPTGTMTFKAYGADDATCTQPAVATVTATVSGNGGYSSGPFTPTSIGTYHWIASYGGDAKNATAGPTSCTATGSSVVVTQAVTTLTARASGAVGLGGVLTDSATLAGGVGASGTVTFHAYGPDDASCGDAAAYTSTALVNGNGTLSSGSFTPTRAGTYRWTATYGGDPNNLSSTTNCNDANQSATVLTTTPTTISTQASATVVVGGQISDTATLSGGASPTGTITFDGYAPGDTSCSNTPAFTATKNVAGNGTVSSGTFTAATAGTYRWTATYSGDTNNAPSSTSCNDAHSTTVVSQATPTTTNQASGTVSVGNTVSDTATLSGGANPTGTVTFDLYGSGDTSCSKTPAFTASKNVTGNGTVSSGTFTAATAGTYRWTAAYSGDTNNAGSATSCNSAHSTTTVSQATPTITNQGSGTVSVGSTVSDTATLSGGANPTGTVTFDLYGPNDASCSTTPVFSATKNVAGNGDLSSGTFAPTTPGTYRWIATYGGDYSNAGSATNCTDPDGSVTVLAPSVTSLTSQATATVTLGSPISDTASLAGGSNPTGKVTFDAYGPGDGSCAQAPAFTSSASVSGDGDYPSGSFTATVPGTYRWVAAYGGDADNDASASGCNDPGVTSVVSPATSTVALTMSASTSTYGDERAELLSVTVPATSSDAAPTGTVKVSESATTLCSLTLNAGSGSCRLANTQLHAGSYHLVASFAGDAASSASTSASKRLEIARAKATLALTLSHVKLRFGHEQVERLSVTTSGTVLIGHVTIRAGAKTLCTISLAAGKGSCRLTKDKLRPGKHPLVAHYNGSANLTASTSAKKSVTVHKRSRPQPK
ncbi:MAG TPA: Ig-like domain repeat protein [Mycobacteriales bacterium]|nr:Ig-like domain repeat protein [Mycobacteriales bacterium]